MNQAWEQLLQDFVKQHMLASNGSYVAARLQAAMALLERLRECAELKLESHRSPGSSGIRSHETFGAGALKRLGLQPINKLHGRRSCQIDAWGQPLLEIVRQAGFEAALQAHQFEIVQRAQEILAAHYRTITEQDPLRVRLKGRSAEDVIHEVLSQAESKRKTGDVAQYLVGAKLMLRFKKDIPIHGANKGDRKSAFDAEARLGDYQMENTIIEVAVGPPDAKHLDQIADILAESDSDVEVWLLTRGDRVSAWRNELKNTEDVKMKQVVVTSVESFVGQNITELGEFSAKGKIAQLLQLFDLYNTCWIAKVGTPGIRIEVSK